MKSQQALWFMLAIGLIACSSTEPEDTIVIYDSHERQYYLDALAVEGVPYRENNDGGISYPVKYREAEKRASDKVRKRFHTGCGFLLNSLEAQKRLVKALDAREFPYQIVPRDDGDWIICSPEYLERIRKLFRETMFQR